LPEINALAYLDEFSVTRKMVLWPSHLVVLVEGEVLKRVMLATGYNVQA